MAPKLMCRVKTQCVAQHNIHTPSHELQGRDVNDVIRRPPTLRPVLLLVSFPRSRSRVVGVSLNVTWCAVCASAAPNNWRIEDVLVVADLTPPPLAPKLFRSCDFLQKKMLKAHPLISCDMEKQTSDI